MTNLKEYYLNKNKMNLSIDELIKLYEKKFNEKKYLYIQRPGSEKLLILLSAHNQRDRYFLLRSFASHQGYNLLFITNSENTWYLDDDYGESYLNLIKSISDSYLEKNIFIFGSSMAGYAAIHFAVKLNLNCITCNPQVNLRMSMDYGWYELNKNISKLVSTKKDISLDDLLNKTFYDGVMCIVHGHAPIDVANVELILGSSAPVRKILVYTLDTDDHGMPFGRDVNKLYQMLDLMSAFSSFSLEVKEENANISVLKSNRKNAILGGVRFPYKTLQKVRSDSYSWHQRHFINRTGIYFFFDVGSYNYLGEFRGALAVYDGEDFEFISGRSQNIKGVNLELNNSEKIRKLNNQDTFKNAWVRVPHDGMLSISTNNVFQATFGKSKNCYLNVELSKEFGNLIKAGVFITCYLDVNINLGSITFSVGAYGASGYYQINKTIDSSGKYFLVFQVSTINLNHKDALFSRIYFYPDAQNKEVTINKLSASIGNFPHHSFWT